MNSLDIDVIRTALDWQSRGQRVVMGTVVRTWGSAPRPPGSLMVIRDDGQVAGSVSGGCIEDDLIGRVARGELALRKPETTSYGETAEESRRFGLPCGGTVELVLEPVAEHTRLPALLQATLARRSTERRLDLRTGAVTLHEGRRDGLPELGDETLVTHFGPRHRLIVIGAGDLSRFLCQMALGLNFEVIVCDPREEQHAGWVLDGVTLSREMPDDLILRLKPDARTAVVALTHDPKLDDLALIDALQSEAFYVGAIGSRRHTGLRRERLREHFGLAEAELDALHGPAGLFIGSKTPAEIALSIMAEVVAVKNGLSQPAPQPVADGKAAQSGGTPAPLPATCAVNA